MESRAAMSCVLKVNINCEGCRRKVMDVLQNLHGVYSVVIDAEEGTVKISGKVNPYIILKVFEKYGKHGEVACIKFEGEVRDPIYYHHHNYYGGNGSIPYGLDHTYPPMGGPDYYSSWCDRYKYAPSAAFPPMAHPPPPPLAPLPRPPPPPPQPVINYFPPKAPSVLSPSTEMNPEWCKIM